MSVTEGIGKPIGYALVIGGAIFAAWYLLKDFDWSSLNPFKDWTWPDPSNVLVTIVPGGEQIQEVSDTLNTPIAGDDTPGDISVKTMTDSLLPGGGIVVGLQTIWDMLTPKEQPVDPWAVGPITPTVGEGTATEYLENALSSLTSASTEAITYTHDEMSVMSAGLTSSPGSGYVQRGTSLTGAPLFEVGPWTQAGVYRLDGYDYSIWRNPVSGALDVATIPGQGGSLASFRNWNPGGEVILW